METSLQQLFIKFRQNIILEANDTKQHYWEAYIVQLAERAEQIKFKSADPHKFLKFPDPDGDILSRLDSLENACYCLSQYALNLCRNPSSDDFHLLKTYAGYYAVNIQSIMEDHDIEVLNLMGYRVQDKCENADEFVLDQRSQGIEYLAFELYLCQAYFRRMKLLSQQALGLKYKRDIIVTMLLQHSLQDIVAFGVQEVCKKVLLESKKNVVEPSDNCDTAGTYEYLDPYAVSGDKQKLSSHANGLPSSHQFGQRDSHLGGGQSYPTSSRLVDETEDDDDDLYGGDADIGENTISPAQSVRKPPSAPPGFDRELPSRTAHTNIYENNNPMNINSSPSYNPSRMDVYDNDYLNKVKLPGENRSQSINLVNQNRPGGGGDSYAERAAGSINRMQRQSSLSDKHQGGLDWKDDLVSGSSNSKSHNLGVSVTSTSQRQKDSSEGVLYKSSDDNEYSAVSKPRQSLKERNRNVDHVAHTDNVRGGSLKRTHITSHVPASDTYMHLDASAKQQLSSPTQRVGGMNMGSGKPSPGYETIVAHDTARRNNRSQGNQNIPNLYSTEVPSSPSSQH